MCIDSYLILSLMANAAGADAGKPTVSARGFKRFKKLKPQWRSKGLPGGRNEVAQVATGKVSSFAVRAAAGQWTFWMRRSYFHTHTNGSSVCVLRSSRKKMTTRRVRPNPNTGSTDRLRTALHHLDRRKGRSSRQRTPCSETHHNDRHVVRAMRSSGAFGTRGSQTVVADVVAAGDQLRAGHRRHRGQL